MAETRHRTVLEIGVDDRQVRGLSKTMDRAFSVQHIEAFERALERTSRTLGKIADQQEKLAKIIADSEKRQAQGGGAGGGGAGGGGAGGGGARGGGTGGAGGGGTGRGAFWGSLGGTAVGNIATRGMGMGNRMGGMAGGMAGGNALGTMLSGIPFAGPAMQGAIQGMMGFYQTYAGQQQAQAGAYGATGIANMRPLMRQGAGLGIDPAQLPGMMANIAQQTGLVGSQLGGGVSAELLQANRYRGFGNLGRVVGAAGAAGGSQENPLEMMSEAVATGVQSGFREGRMDQFFQQFSGWLEGLRSRGIPLEVGSALQLVRGISSLGGSLKGGAGMAAAQQFQQGLAGASRRSGPGALLALRAAGLAGGGYGNRTFSEAERQLENEPHTVMRNFLGMLGGMGIRNADVGQQLIRNVSQELGINLSASNAYDIASSVISGDVEGAMSGLITPETAETVEEMATRRATGGNAASGTAQVEAKYQLRRAGIGAENAGRVGRIREFEASTAQTMLRSLGPMIDKTLAVMTTLLEAFQEGGIAGLLKEALAQALSTLLPNVEAPDVRELINGPTEADLAGQYRAQHYIKGNMERMLMMPEDEGDYEVAANRLAEELDDLGMGFNADQRRRAIEGQRGADEQERRDEQQRRENLPLSGNDNEEVIISEELPGPQAAYHLNRAAEYLNQMGKPGEGDLTSAVS